MAKGLRKSIARSTHTRAPMPPIGEEGESIAGESESGEGESSQGGGRVEHLDN